MLVNELRIGNWVKIKEEFSKTEFPLKTLEFEIKGFNDGTRRRDEGAKQILYWSIPNIVFGTTVSGSYDIECEPIPLTEEWLLKFGFEPLGSSRFDFKIFTYYLYDGSFYNQSSRLSTIKYVHQLQNLYFALTGEELKIKE